MHLWSCSASMKLLEVNSLIQKTQGHFCIRSQSIFCFQCTPPFKCQSNVHSTSIRWSVFEVLGQTFAFLGWGERFCFLFSWSFEACAAMSLISCIRHILLILRCTVKTEAAWRRFCWVGDRQRIGGWGCTQSIKDWNLAITADIVSLFHSKLLDSVSWYTHTHNVAKYMLYCSEKVFYCSDICVRAQTNC